MYVESDVLREIGFTNGEIKVYTALLELGSTTTGKVVKNSGISSSKVYVILDRLANKGLVTHVIRENRKHFQASSPRKIMELLRDKEQSVKAQEDMFGKILPGLLMKEKMGEKKHEAFVYEGYGGVKTYFENLLKESKKGEERFVFGARSGYPVSKPAQRFFRSYEKKRVKTGIKLRIIFNNDMRKTALEMYREHPLTEVRFLPNVTMSSIGISRNGIDILLWTKGTAVVFAISSREVANTFRKYFELLWKTASK